MTTETQTRRCIGSTRFDIEAHDADAGDFPVQPSQKDGLGRMCKPHWREYTNALRKAAVARKATAETAEAGPESVPEPAPQPIDEAEEPIRVPTVRTTPRPSRRSEIVEDSPCRIGHPPPPHDGPRTRVRGLFSSSVASGRRRVSFSRGEALDIRRQLHGGADDGTMRCVRP